MYCTRCGEANQTEKSVCTKCGSYVPGPEQITSGAKEQTDELCYAGLWTRFCASFVDGLILTAATLPLVGVFILLPMSFPGQAGSSFAVIGIPLLYIFVLIVTWLYEAYMDSSSKEATYGKMAMGLKVADLSGNRITFRRATGRHFAKFISSLICNVGFLMVAFTEKKQGLHDMMAGTCVVFKSGKKS